MNILDISIIIFIIMESMNVCVLYFCPQTKICNGVGVFNGFENSKKDENIHLFAKYMTNWVAGTKLIFIVLLAVILCLGTEELKMYSVLVMILSIMTYFFKLHPIIKKLDKNGEITPKGYSKALFGMILGFIIMFSSAFIYYFVTK